MAPRKKASKRTTTRRGPAKSARKSAKKATRKTAKKATKRTTKKSAKKVTKKSAKKATKRGAKKAGTAKTASTTAPSRPKNVKFTTRKKGVFTQTDLIDQIQEWNPDLSKAQSRQVVNDVLNTLQTAIQKTDKVRLKGIGTITKKKIPARRGGKMVKNPFTGELVKQKPRPASVKVKISPSKEIKQA